MNAAGEDFDQECSLNVLGASSRKGKVPFGFRTRCLRSIEGQKDGCMLMRNRGDSLPLLLDFVLSSGFPCDPVSFKEEM